MAYDFSKEKKEVLLEIDRHGGDKVHVTSITRDDSSDSWVDFRIMYTPKDSDELRPTQKGVRISSEFIPEIVDALIGLMSGDQLIDLANKVNSMTEE